MVAAAKTANTVPATSELHRVIGWKDAFWVASGVPALVLFSIGGIAATVGTPSVLVWTLVRHLRLSPSLYLRGDCRSLSQQVWRSIGLWRSRLGALLEIHRAALGVVQLARLDAGACYRLRYRRRLYPECVLPSRSRDPHLGDPAPRPRLHEGRPQASAQLDLLHRRDPDPDLLRHSASGHPEHCQGADHRRRGGASAAAHHRHRAADHRRRGDAGVPALRTRHRSRDRGLEQGRLDAVLRRSVYRRLVGLRLRDGDLLHERVPRPGDRHLQGHPLFRPALHRRLHSRARSPSRAPSVLPE